MQVTIVLCFLGVAIAAPTTGATDNKNAETLQYKSDKTGFGPLKFVYAKNDWSKHKQQDKGMDAGRENERLVVTGKYTFDAPGGVVYAVTYVADENGYQHKMTIGEQEQKLPEGLGVRSVGEIARLLG